MSRVSRKIIDSFCEPMAVVSETGEILTANQAFEQMTQPCSERAWLADLFGSTVGSLVEDALLHGEARETFSMHTRDGTRYVRIALKRETADRLCAQMIDLTDEMSWRERASEHDQTLTVLKDIGSALSAAVDLDALTEMIYEQTNRVIETSNFYVALHEQDTHTVSFPRYLEDGEWKELMSRPFGDGLTEYVIQSRSPLLLEENVAERARALGIAPVGRASLAWLGVPMITEDRAIGMIGIQDYERSNCYGPLDLKLLMVIAGQAAAAIRNTRLLSAARRAYRELSETQERLLEAERLRGVTETVGTLNHEVNNPLSAISGNAQLLLRAARSLESDVRRKVESILESARRIQHVTSKMETLIQASSIPYPGGDAILDVESSVSSDELITGVARSAKRVHSRPH